ncbi:MAG: response regulator [Methanobacterium sp.]
MKMVDTLVVEDNPGDARLIMEAFDGFAVENKINVVPNGAEAMDYLYKNGKYKDVKTPHIIILDLNLPKKDGRSVLKEIKTDSSLRKIPVIVLTTSKDETDICSSYMNYANAYMTKPTDFDDFIDLINTFESFWFSKVILPGCKDCK